ncbi:MAG: hypothetical protein KME64_35125 [Scytonematopsis contorta HA4267-MV1]|nr:hypothetical protein [Scytonematopsis contorta HA4267-MV1]
MTVDWEFAIPHSPLPTPNCELRIANCELRIANCELRIVFPTPHSPICKDMML